jgi:DNA-binding IscR family transcriptional regulator
MFKINKKVEYALIVLKHFEQLGKDELITARLICDTYNTPFDTTSKVMQIMNNHKILESSQGVKGGYKVSIDLRQINYLQLMEIIEGKEISNNCTSTNCSLIESCNITGPIKKLNEYLMYFFKGLSIKELLEDGLGPQSIIFNTTQDNR